LARERRAKQTENLMRQVTKSDETTTPVNETPQERRNRLAREKRQYFKMLKDEEKAKALRKAQKKAVRRAEKTKQALARPLSSIADPKERSEARYQYKKLGVYNIDTDPDKEEVLRQKEERRLQKAEKKRRYIDHNVKEYMDEHERWYKHILSRKKPSDTQKNWFIRYSQALQKSKANDPNIPLFNQDPLYLFAEAERNGDSEDDRIWHGDGPSMLVRRAGRMMAW
jgi:hypothetical protein